MGRSTRFPKSSISSNCHPIKPVCTAYVNPMPRRTIVALSQFHFREFRGLPELYVGIFVGIRKLYHKFLVKIQYFMLKSMTPFVSATHPSLCQHSRYFRVLSRLSGSLRCVICMGDTCDPVDQGRIPRPSLPPASRASVRLVFPC